jgi:hypothetical protein
MRHLALNYNYLSDEIDELQLKRFEDIHQMLIMSHPGCAFPVR